jgi:hypothetical protein
MPTVPFGHHQTPALGARDLIDAGKLVEILADYQAVHPCVIAVSA